MTVIAPEAIRDAEERIREMTEDIAIANEELATAKKLAKRKFETAIKGLRMHMTKPLRRATLITLLCSAKRMKL